MESEKLLPCPMCAGEGEAVCLRIGEDAVASWVRCLSCGLRTAEIEDAYSDLPSAIAAWNTRAPAELTEWRDIETAPKEGFIVGGFFTDAGTRYAQPVVLVCRERDHPSRTEYYAGKQRMFPTHFLTFSPDLAPATTRAPADLRSALEALPTDKYGENAIDCISDHAENGTMPPQFREDLRALLALAALAPTKGDVS